MATKKPALPKGVEVETTTKAFSRSERRVYQDGRELGFVRKEQMAGWTAYLKDTFYKPDAQHYGQRIHHAAPKGKFDSGYGFEAMAEAVERLVEVAGWNDAEQLAYQAMRDRQRDAQHIKRIRKHLADAVKYTTSSYERIETVAAKSDEIGQAMDCLKQALELTEKALSALPPSDVGRSEHVGV